jgi:hypothetical protein
MQVLWRNYPKYGQKLAHHDRLDPQVVLPAFDRRTVGLIVNGGQCTVKRLRVVPLTKPAS